MRHWTPLVDELGYKIEGYEISSDGMIRSYWGRGRQGLIHEPATLSQYVDKGKRASVEIRIEHGREKRFLVHRLVAFAYLPEPAQDRGDVLHKNHDTLDNRSANLAWATKQELADHSLRHVERWNNNGGAPKLSTRQINAIKNSDLTRAELAAKYQISERQVSRVKAGLTGRRTKSGR